MAIAAMSAGGLWAPSGVAVAAAALTHAAFRSFVRLRSQADSIPRFLRMRMMGVTATVSVAAGALTAGSVTWLVAELVG